MVIIIINTLFLNKNVLFSLYHVSNSWLLTYLESCIFSFASLAVLVPFFLGPSPQSTNVSALGSLNWIFNGFFLEKAGTKSCFFFSEISTCFFWGFVILPWLTALATEGTALATEGTSYTF